MLGAVSDNIYSMQPTHSSDSKAHCARRAIRACLQGDAIECLSISEKSTVIREIYKQQYKYIERKREGTGWLVYPIFPKAERDRRLAKHKKRKQEQNDQQKSQAKQTQQQGNSQNETYQTPK